MLEIKENVPLGTLNSFGIAARARYFATFETADDLRRFFAGRTEGGTPWYVFSGGNNILLGGDYPGTLLHPVAQGIRRLKPEKDKVLVQADAGVEWDDFVAWAVAGGLGGVENLSLIPGYVGAAPVQNIGAYGAEVKDTIREVEVYLPEEDRVKVFTRDECRFGYRDSIFKRDLKGRCVILSVTFALDPEPEFRLGYGDLKTKVEEAGTTTLETVRNAVIAIRRSKLPDPKELGNAGSFFKNPVVEQSVAEALRERYPEMPVYPAGTGQAKLAAGWLIDRAGWKGKRTGCVGVHERQALVLVNYGGAAGGDVIALADEVCGEVERMFGVRIEKEVNIL